MDNRLRVLHVITGMGSGGAEMFLMNMYRNMNKNKIVFDFLLQSDQNIFKEELESYGSRIFTVPPYYKHPMQNRTELKEILREGYQIVHVHANALMYILPIIYAKKAGIPCRIMHSHNTSLLYKWALPYHKFNKRRVEKYATHRFACSQEAGEWMFNSNFIVIRNAVDLNRFAFNEKLRTQYRQELGVSKDDLVIGQIGRLSHTKNQDFTLDVLSSLRKKVKNCRLLFVGEGTGEQALRDKTCNMDLEENVEFLGVRSDVNQLINAFDILMLPSLYEGLPVVMIEAQANGITVFCSTNITVESVYADNIHRLSLDLGPETWAENILNSQIYRRDNSKELKEAGFDIQYEAKKLQDFYINSTKGIN